MSMDTVVSKLDRELYLKKRSDHERSIRRTKLIVKRWQREDVHRAEKRRKRK